MLVDFCCCVAVGAFSVGSTCDYQILVLMVADHKIVGTSLQKHDIFL
jgi:hypothetical protein